VCGPCRGEVAKRHSGDQGIPGEPGFEAHRQFPQAHGKAGCGMPLLLHGQTGASGALRQTAHQGRLREGLPGRCGQVRRRGCGQRRRAGDLEAC
jgi:hypothetical protein